jgi:hypothetical protein
MGIQHALGEQLLGGRVHRRECGGELVACDRLAGDADALDGLDQVRRSVQAGSEAGRA